MQFACQSGLFQGAAAQAGFPHCAPAGRSLPPTKPLSGEKVSLPLPASFFDKIFIRDYYSWAKGGFCILKGKSQSPKIPNHRIQWISSDIGKG
jgi:hypothetical protein